MKKKIKIEYQTQPERETATAIEKLIDGLNPNIRKLDIKLENQEEIVTINFNFSKTKSKKL